MHDYDVFTVDSKADVLDKSREFWNPGKTDFWSETGVDLVIDRRESYFIWDMSGLRLIDVHLNGGTYNLGHRNPELVEAITTGMRSFDIGNHHFPSSARAALAEALIRSAPPNLTKVVYGSGGGEAIDIALKTARHATKRRKIVSIVKAYHGHTGLAVATGDDRFSRLFLSDRPEEFTQVPFNDLAAMEQALAGGDVAAVIMETIPATYGFPLPDPGYLEAVKALCERHGTLYIADEVQTGLMRTGEMWGITKHGIEPDILVTGKGLSGGMYPIAAVLVSEQCAGWLTEDGFAHISTFGGAELGCVAALKTLEICSRPETRSMVHYISDADRRGLRGIQADYPDWFTGIRQNGVVMGLEFDHPEGAKYVMRHLYRTRGVGDLLDPGPAGAAVQTGPADDPRAVRGAAGADRRRDRAGRRRGPGQPRREPPVSGPVVTGPMVTGPVVTSTAATWRAKQLLARAHWAAGRVRRATTGPRCCGSPRRSPGPRTRRPRKYAEWAVKETGFGVAEHKVLKNEACSLGHLRALPGRGPRQPAAGPGGQDHVAAPAGRGGARADPVHQPGVQRLLQGHPGLLTRNAIVVSPHPMAKECCGDAVRMLAAAATEAGAPDGVISLVEDVTVPLDRGADGRPGDQRDRGHRGHRGGPGRAPVRQPGAGRRPGQRPGAGRRDRGRGRRGPADHREQGLRQLGAVHQRVGADRRGRRGRPAAARAAAVRPVLLDEAGRDRLRDYLFPDGRLNGEAIGKDASWIAARAGLRVPPRTKVLLAPFRLVLPEEPFAREKLSPVLGVVTDGVRGRAASRRPAR